METWSAPTRLSVPDYGRNPTGGSGNFAPARRAEVAAPTEPEEHEVVVVAEFLRGRVYRGFYFVAEPAK